MVSVVVVEEDVDIEVSLVVVDVLLLEVNDDVEVVASSTQREVCCSPCGRNNDHDNDN